MKSLMWKTTGVLALAMLALGSVGTAHASHLNIRVAEPTQAIAGQPSELDATVTSADTGQAVAGMNVTFFAHASFGKISGYMEIGRAVTNDQGVAAISFVPRESGTHDIRVDYALPSGGTTEQTVTSVSVEGTADQVYVQTAGIQVPGLNSWLIIGLLTVVWGILFGVALTVVRIARAGAGRAFATGLQGATIAAGPVPNRGAVRSGR